MQIFRMISCAVVAALLTACASTQTRHPDYGQDCDVLAPGGLGQAVDCVRVFYGTNRAVITSVPMTSGIERDSLEVGSTDSGELALGRADIWLPKLIEDGGSRELGDTPMLKGKYPEDKEELHTYIFVTRITKNGRESFIEKLNADMASRQNDAVLLFIHGFNVKFEDALIRSAQLTVDLGQGNLRKPGSPVLFSWPSAGKMSLGQYKKDGKQAAAAVPHLEAFLDILTTDMDISKINIVAHSMGNRVLVGALESYAADYLETHPNQDIEFRIILAAADVERDIFDQVAGKLEALKPNVVIYTSDDDLALTVSRIVNGNPRLGDTDNNKPYIRSVQGYETVDATPVASELFGLGHGYYSSNPFILGDIRCALADQQPIERALRLRRYDDQDDGLEFFQTDAKAEVIFEECELRRSTVPNNETGVRFSEQSGSGRGPGGPPKRPTIVVPPAIILPPTSVPMPPPMPEPAPQPMEEIARMQSQIIFYFESGKSELTSVHREQIQTALSIGSVQYITIQGYTDSAGHAAANKRLSQKRAQSAADEFIAFGVSAQSINVSGLGEADPTVASEDGANEALNRRVMVTIFYDPDS